MKAITIKQMSNGLWLSGPNDKLPEGFMRRFRGVSSISTNSILTRDGSDLLYSLNAHSLTYFNSTWYAGVSTDFYSAGSVIKQSLSGDRLSFASMPPTAGGVDYLFVAGGDELFKASDIDYADGTELITNGDMELDANWSNYGSPSTNERSSTQTYGGTYSRKFTVDASNEGIRGATFTTVALAWYSITAYVYPDDGTDVRIRIRNGTDDAFTYNILHDSLTQDAWNEITFVYQEASGKGGSGAYIVFEGDDATSGSWYVDEVTLQRTYYVTQWGINAPSLGPTLTDLGDGGGAPSAGTYRYRLTYKNSTTGTRSNGSPITEDNVKLILHFDNDVTDATSNHTPVNNGACTFSSGTKKVGTHSVVMNGSSQWVSVPDHDDFYLASEDFTIHFWIRFDALSSIYAPLFSQGDDPTHYQELIYSPYTQFLSFHVQNHPDPVTVSVGFDWSTVAIDTWYHLAIVREGSVLRIFLDGELKGTDTFFISSFPNFSGDLRIGHPSHNHTSYYHDGYFDEFIWVKGEALWSGGASFTPPETATASNAITTAGNNTIELTAIPESDDPQVSEVEIWRTQESGTAYFYLTSISNGTTTFDDAVADADLAPDELPTDNLVPYSWFDDCYGPWNGSMFWITRTQSGKRGRVYYSPIGRAEAVQGFIEVTSDDDGLQRIESYAGQLFVLSKARAYQIYGDNPYFSREVAGVPGTNAPQTLVITPFGPMWESNEGPRIFDGGARSKLIAYDQIKPIFRGKTIENLASFTGTVATFARGEYIVSDGTNTLALDVENMRWRDLGVGCNALSYSPEADQIAATVSNTILDFEKEGETDDNSTNISFDIQWPEITLDMPFAVELIRINADANTETLTCYAILNGSSSSQGNLSTTAGRRWNEFALNARLVDRLGVRLTGSINAIVEVFEMQVIYWPMELRIFIEGEQPVSIPGRLSADRQTLTFEAFSDDQHNLQDVFVFQDFFYDLNSNSEDVVATLTLINESSISLGTLNTASRTVSEVNIVRKGRFQKLTLAGDFTADIRLRRVELTAKRR